MYLYRQAGRKTWQIRWWSGGVKRQTSTGTSDRAAAERVLLAMRQAAAKEADQAMVEKLLRLAFEDRNQCALSLEDAAAEFARQREGGQQTKLVVWHWLRFAKWCQAHWPAAVSLRSVDLACCKAFYGSLDGSTATRRNVVRNCATLWHLIAPQCGVYSDPWRQVRPTGGHDTQRPPLTDAQCEKLLSVTSGEFRGACLTGLYTGLRYHDIAMLRWEQIVHDTICLAPSKTKRRGIAVAIPLHPLLARYIAGLRRTGPMVFPGLAASYSRRGKNPSGNPFTLAKRAAGLPQHATFHSLRHTFVSRLKAAGVPEDIRMALAGHTQAETHAGYTHGLEQERLAILKLQ